MEEDGLFDVLPKKKLLNLKEYDRLIKFLGGIRDMKSMPQALFVVDLVKSVTRLLKHVN